MTEIIGNDPLARQLLQWNKDVHEDVPKVPEHIFRNDILPVLTDRSGHADIGIWLDIAGTAMRPLDVIAPNGDLLFRTPPLYPQTPVRVSEGYQTSVSAVGAEAELRHEQHPAIGRTFLNGALERLDPGLPDHLKQRREWSAILVRYGYPPLVNEDGTEVVVPTTATNDVPTTAQTVPVLGDDQDDF